MEANKTITINDSLHEVRREYIKENLENTESLNNHDYNTFLENVFGQIDDLRKSNNECPKILTGYIKFCELINIILHPKKAKRLGSKVLKISEDNLDKVLQGIETTNENRTIENAHILNEQSYYAAMYHENMLDYMSKILRRKLPCIENPLEEIPINKMEVAREKVLALNDQYKRK